jgi:hypothetical protein
MTKATASHNPHAPNTPPIPDRNTLKVYWYFFTQPHGKVGIRQVQRAMGFSSPNAAIFHLNKLVDMKLVTHQQNGDYQLLHRSRFGIMKSFLFLGCYSIPKHAIYATIMTCTMLSCTILLLPVLSLPMIIALLPGLLALTILWYEAYIVWQQKPTFQ